MLRDGRTDVCGQAGQMLGVMVVFRCQIHFVQLCKPSELTVWDYLLSNVVNPLCRGSP